MQCWTKYPAGETSALYCLSVLTREFCDRLAATSQHPNSQPTLCFTTPLFSLSSPSSLLFWALVESPGPPPGSRKSFLLSF